MIQFEERIIKLLTVKHEKCNPSKKTYSKRQLDP
jgi:hypothetical protein